MQLRRRVALTSLIFIGISLVLTFTLVLLSDYRYNDITYVGETELRAQVIDDVKIEGDYFLLTPKLLIEYRLNRLEYIKNATVQKVLPNQITITYETNLPSFCDAAWLYYEESTVPLTDDNSSKCTGIPQIESFETFNAFDDFLEKYESLNLNFRSNVASVDSIDNYYRFTMLDSLVIKVYLEDFEKLDVYDQYQVQEDLLDLRPKYS